MKMKDQILILGSQNCVNITEKIYKDISDKCSCDYEIINEKKFNCGESTLVLKSDVKNKIVFVVCDAFNNDSGTINENIMFSLFVAHTARIYEAKEINFIFPFFPYSRQDRFKNQIKEPVSLKLIINLLESLKPKNIITIDIHNTSSFLSVSDSLLINLDVKNLIKKEIIKDNSNLILSPTDFSGTKKIIEISKKYKLPYIMVGKYRDDISNDIEEQFIMGEVLDKDVLIIDDMIDSGSTVLNLIKILKEKGAKNVSIYVSHALFSKNSYEKFKELLDQKIIDKLYLGNTTERNFEKFDKNQIVEIDVLKKISKFILLRYS